MIETKQRQRFCFFVLFSCVLALYLCAASISLAVLPDEILDNPALEMRARALSKDLRCPVCHNETIDESLSPLARDLRLLIRERLLMGDSDAEIVDFITRRYGDFILLAPPFNLKTALLWLSPLLILSATLSIIFIRTYAHKADKS